MAWDISRRVFLRGAGLAAVGVGISPSSLLVRTAQAAAGTKVLVKVFLRGGADGLNMVVPHGDPDYLNLRRDIGLSRGQVVDLDGFFGLHPQLGSLKPLWDAGRLAAVHAVGNYGLTRSHFDAQDFMETGTPGVKETATGWLDRAIARIPGNEVTQAVSFSSQLPRSFLGPEPVLVAQNLSQFSIRARNWQSEGERLLREMYSGLRTDAGRVGQETFTAIDSLVRTPQIQAAPANGAVYPNAAVGNSLRQVAQIVKSNLGTRCIYVNVSGAFDTHANQLTANANDYSNLGASLAAFATDLGGLLDDVVVMVTTEFGRTAAVNGSAGTDHGSAYAMLLLGGPVRGGRVYGRWPGLAGSQLYQQRDLAVTTDFRDAFQEIARAQFGITESLFPGYNPGAGPGAAA